MKKTAWTVAAVVGIVAALATDAQAVGPGGHGRRGHGGGHGVGMLLRNPELAEKAGVTDEQIQALEDLMYEQRKEMIGLKAQEQLAHLEQRRLMDQEPANMAAILKAVEEVGRIRTELAKAGVKRELQVREILGAETLDKLAGIARKEMFKGRDGGRGRKRQGRDRSWQEGGRPFPPPEDVPEDEPMDDVPPPEE